MERLEKIARDEAIEIQEIKANKPAESYWTSLWTNSPKPYPPAMPGPIRERDGEKPQQSYQQ